MSEEFDVGYGKPPKSGQFKKGKSGNPKGRPKGTKNLKSDLQDELGEKIVISESGKTKKISKQKALVKGIAAKAIGGNVPAMKVLLDLIVRVTQDDPDSIPEESLSAADKQILENFKSEILKSAPRKTKGEK